ncbi:P-loop containing nucleoside triphosphate hydrolase protein [Gorgonomyces haynaldii]|nr:P-loop containing nucleoside triphosphate hydrolase protein [Gorgonomyces haynaldii]
MIEISPTLLKQISLVVLSQVMVYYGVKYLIEQMDPTHKKRIQLQSKTKRILGRMGVKQELTEHEQIIASEIIWPDDIPVSFQDIGGLEEIIDSLNETVIYPLVLPGLFTQGLLGPPKGVLLYGPPGCGKTMLAKALAKESNATFINLHVSTLTEKWFGESQKLVNALFSLARKLEPTIIFIDEIDSFLRERKSHDNEATSMMKAEFMTLWDGLLGEGRVIVLGCTNRPNDIDKAILRRMPKRYCIGLPNKQQRKDVLDLILKKIVMDDVNVDFLAARTEGYSNSDLKELCRNAVLVPVREAIRSAKKRVQDLDPKQLAVRPVKQSDFMIFIDTLFDSELHLPTVPEPVD